MCFAEYVAYICGHTSVAVNRPCPMTTHLHNNPVCPKPACRPFLAHTMCHPCTRIMHSRRVDIAEYEHRFMHERGACDCEVQFPALLQPRVVRRSSAVTEEDEAAATTENGVGAGTSTTDYALLQGELSPMSSCDIGRPSTQQNTSDQAEKATIPLFQESQVGEKVEIAVRLSSLYGAEWTGDHAELHKSGQCHCPVSFERYKPHRVEDCEGEDSIPESGAAWGTSDEFPHPQADTAAAFASLSYTGPRGLGDNSAADDNSRYENGRIPLGRVARWAMAGPQVSLLDHILGPAGSDANLYGGHPVDIQTAHYDYQGLPIVGNPIACGTVHESELPSVVEYQQPEVTLAGFPIGAGPEGDSHAGDFDSCSLPSSSECLSPVRMRRLSSEF